MVVHVPIAGSLTQGHTRGRQKPWTWTAPTVIAPLALASVLCHLVLRFLVNAPRIVWQSPLVLALIAGGLPLLVPLARKLLAREFGSDHLAGISIATSVILGEYLVGVIVILMLSGGTALLKTSPLSRGSGGSPRCPLACRACFGHQ